MDNQITNYKDTPHKIRYLFEVLKELQGLEIQLIKELETLKAELENKTTLNA